jgi:hypothetical protein
VYANGALQGTRSAGANATSVQVGNLNTNPSIAYTFRVAARNSAGTGAASGLMGPVSFTAAPVTQNPVAGPPVSLPPNLGPEVIALSGAPRLLGTPQVGARLRVKMPKITTPGRAKVTYTWKVNGKKIKGITGKTYKVRAADAGKRVKVVLKITKRGFKPMKVATKPVRIRR